MKEKNEDVNKKRSVIILSGLAIGPNRDVTMLHLKKKVHGTLVVLSRKQYLQVAHAFLAQIHPTLTQHRFRHKPVIRSQVAKVRSGFTADLPVVDVIRVVPDVSALSLADVWPIRWLKFKSPEHHRTPPLDGVKVHNSRTQKKYYV